MTERRARTEALLAKRYGALLGGRDLRDALGFRSTSAFNRAVRDGYLDLNFFTLPGRRGRFALVADVADWLEMAAQAKERERASGRSRREGAQM